MPNLTEWFPPEIKPAYPGVYLIKSVFKKSEPFYSKWDGTKWIGLGNTAKEVIHDKYELSNQTREWRGLAQPPVTDWFPGDVKPVHVGLYEINCFAGTFFQYWNGKFWGYFGTKDYAIENKYRKSGVTINNKKWRGLQVNVCPQ